MFTVPKESSAEGRGETKARTGQEAGEDEATLKLPLFVPANQNLSSFVRGVIDRMRLIALNGPPSIGLSDDVPRHPNRIHCILADGIAGAETIFAPNAKLISQIGPAFHVGTNCSAVIPSANYIITLLRAGWEQLF